MSKKKTPKQPAVFYPARIIVRQEFDGDESYLLVSEDAKDADEGMTVAIYERVEIRNVHHTTVLEEI